MIEVRVPATTANLGPGFDCLGLALQLHNTVELELADGFEVEITGEGEHTLARDERNLVLQAALRLAERAAKTVPGLRLTQHNAIPLARGMGSSSAAIVGGLVAANALLELQMDRSELLDLAAEIEGHPDNVAPALLGGLTVCCFEGELLCERFPAPDGLTAVVAVPDFTVSTEEARLVMPRDVPHADAVYNTTHAAVTLASLLSGNYDLLQGAMRDRLHQPYRAHLVPGFEATLQAALDAGALGAAMSGSGPTLIAFARGREAEIAEAMQQTFAAFGVRAETMSLRLDDIGAQVVERV
jgi:homoserine kinase